MKMKKQNANTLSKEQFISEIWCLWTQDINLNYFRSLANSMSSRLQMVIKAIGGMTKY